jgi:hypothetical protein
LRTADLLAERARQFFLDLKGALAAYTGRITAALQ